MIMESHIHPMLLGKWSDSFRRLQINLVRHGFSAHGLGHLEGIIDLFVRSHAGRLHFHDMHRYPSVAQQLTDTFHLR